MRVTESRVAGYQNHLRCSVQRAGARVVQVVQEACSGGGVRVQWCGVVCVCEVCGGVKAVWCGRCRRGVAGGVA